LEKFYAAVPQQAALGCSSGAVPSFPAAELFYPPQVDMGFSMRCSSDVGLAPSVLWKSFLSSKELSLTSLNASLRSEGFSPEPVSIVSGFESFGATFSKAAALGERLRLFCLVMLLCRAPISSSKSKQCRDISGKRRKAV